MKKKLTALFLAVVMCMTLGVPAFANDSNNSVSDADKEKISAIYLMPVSDLNEMTDEQIAPYLENLDALEPGVTDVVYVQVERADDGSVTAQQFSEEEFIESQISPQASITQDRDWIKITSSLSKSDSTTSTAAAHYEWLDAPNFRMNDIVAILIHNGTVVSQSAYGYHKQTYVSNGATKTYTNYFIGSTDYDCDFEYYMNGIVTMFDLNTEKALADNDEVYISCSLYKEGNSEGIETYYAHQMIEFDVDVSCSFELTEEGLDIALGGSVDVDEVYDVTHGYVSIDW